MIFANITASKIFMTASLFISPMAEFSLERMFDSFSNDEGFDALIRRLATARASMLSVREFESNAAGAAGARACTALWMFE